MAVLWQLIVMVALMGSSQGLLLVYPFTDVSPELYDIWKKANPEHINENTTFSVIYGSGDVLWFVSRGPSPTHLAPTSTLGGVVSTYHINTGSWLHKAYGRLDEDDTFERLWSLGGHLFLLSYDMFESQLFARKLFFWDDENGGWIPLESDISLKQPLAYANPKQVLKVSIPDQDGHVAYIDASSYSDQNASLGIWEMDVKFANGTPVSANFTAIKFLRPTDSVAVGFTALYNNTLYIFSRYFLHRLGKPDLIRLEFVIDLETRNLTFVAGNVTADETGPITEFEFKRIFQLGDHVVFIGPWMKEKKGRQIWSYDLNSGRDDQNVISVPNWDKAGFALDQKKNKLFMAGLKLE